VDQQNRPEAAKRFQIAIVLLLVAIYAVFAVLALVRENWVAAGVMVVFLVVAVVMLRQRWRTGEPISFLTTVVQMLTRRGSS
jgi:membrane protein YdbS with pleckstrin-like domain